MFSTSRGMDRRGILAALLAAAGLAACGGGGGDGSTGATAAAGGAQATAAASSTAVAADAAGAASIDQGVLHDGSALDAKATATASLPINTGLMTKNSGRGQHLWMSPYYLSAVPSDSGAVDSYRRFDWRELQKDNGAYDFSLIEQELAAAKARGGRFSFGLMAIHEGGPNNAMPTVISNASNSWTVASSWTGQTLVVPDWNSEGFLGGWDRLMAALGARYANDERLAWLDIGGYGNWGEWHNLPFADMYPTQTGGRNELTVGNAKRMINAVATAFPNKQLMMAFGITWRNPSNPQWRSFDIGNQVFDYAMTRSTRIGWRMNMLGDAENYAGLMTIFNAAQAYSQGLGRPVSQQPMQRWRTAPFWAEYDGMAPGSSGNNFQIALSNGNSYHVSSLPNASFSGALGSYPSAQQSAYRTALATAGFALSMKQASYTTPVARGAWMPLSVQWVNNGVAPTYDPWAVVYRLHNQANGGLYALVNSPLDLRTVAPGATVTDPVAISTQGIPAGTYTVSMRATNGAASYLAPLMTQNTGTRTSDGGYVIGTVTVQ